MERNNNMKMKTVLAIVNDQSEAVYRTKELIITLIKLLIERNKKPFKVSIAPWKCVGEEDAINCTINEEGDVFIEDDVTIDLKDFCIEDLHFITEQITMEQYEKNSN